MSSLIYFTEKQKRMIYEGLNALMVEKMATLNRTRNTPWMFPDPEEAREKLYDEMDEIEDLMAKMEVFDD